MIIDQFEDHFTKIFSDFLKSIKASLPFYKNVD